VETLGSLVGGSDEDCGEQRWSVTEEEATGREEEDEQVARSSLVNALHFFSSYSLRLL
jgi:hypothetical protein